MRLDQKFVIPMGVLFNMDFVLLISNTSNHFPFNFDLGLSVNSTDMIKNGLFLCVKNLESSDNITKSFIGLLKN